MTTLTESEENYETDFDYIYKCGSCKTKQVIEDLVTIKKHGYTAGSKCPDCGSKWFRKIDLE